MKEAAVMGMLSGYRTTVDGGLRITVDLDELQASVFHDAFRQVNIMVAVARLEEPTEAS